MISLHLSRELHLEPEVRADLPKPRSILSIHPPLSARTLGALDIIVIVLSLFFFFFLLFFFSSFFVLRRAASTLAARGRQLAMDTVSSTPRKPNTWLLLWCSVTLALFCLAYMSGIDEILPNHNISPLWALTSRPYLAARPSIAGEMSRPEVSSAIEPAWTRTNESQECELPWTTLALDEASLLSCAARLGRQRQRQDGLVPKPRVAFLFITRDRLPHEALWRRFFRGHEDRYSVYVHSRPDYESPSESLFHNHHVPSEGVRRLSMSLVRAMRRLLAYAIVDPDHGPSNSWFVYACEATVPIRSFDFVYEYLTNSQQSFVESFLPHRKYLTWDTEPEFRNSSLRKGELWMAVHARHAVMILNDTTIFNKFNTSCKAWCGPDEQYIQTLLGQYRRRTSFQHCCGGMYRSVSWCRLGSLSAGTAWIDCL